MLNKIRDKLNSIRRYLIIYWLFRRYNRCIKNARNLDSFTRELGLENDQRFLDWQDELNKISVS